MNNILVNAILMVGYGVATTGITYASSAVANKVVKVKEVPADAENPEKLEKKYRRHANLKKALIVAGTSTIGSIGLAAGITAAECNILKTQTPVNTEVAETEVEATEA